MIERIMRAIRLDPDVYREIAEDENAMTEAAIIVLIVTGLSALGTAIAAEGFIGPLLVNWLMSVVVGWIGWAVLTYFIGAKLFGGRSSIAEMMRVLGYATAPRLLGILGFIPCLGWLAALIGAILALIAGVIAVRESASWSVAARP